MNASAYTPNSLLPKKWRNEVAQSLARKGIVVNLQKISDARRGRLKDEKLTNKILETIHRVALNHQKNKKRNQRIRKKLNAA